MSADADRALMRRAIALARTGLGMTGANPSVGCVIARDGRVIAEAVTAGGGRPHAEEQALDVAGDGARGAVAFISLEPCGERSSGAPSCASRLIAAGIARVAYACGNPDRRSAGSGPGALEAARVSVERGLLADEAADLYATLRSPS